VYRQDAIGHFVFWFWRQNAIDNFVFWVFWRQNAMDNFVFWIFWWMLNRPCVKFQWMNAAPIISCGWFIIAKQRQWRATSSLLRAMRPSQGRARAEPGPSRGRAQPSWLAAPRVRASNPEGTSSVLLRWISPTEMERQSSANCTKKTRPAVKTNAYWESTDDSTDR